MKADIQSQIMMNSGIIVQSMIYGPETFGLTEKDISDFKRRNVFLDQVLNAPCSEIDQKAINFVMGR